VTTCAFSQDIDIQGHTCRGGGLLGGGAEGIQTSFYPDGSLKSFFLPENTTLQGIPCRASIFTPVQLYENGQLKSCLLSAILERNGHTYPAGTHLQLDESGQVISQ
jgi:hypothetical protein